MPSRPSDEPELWLVQQAFLQDLVGGDSRTPEEREAVFQAPPRGSVEDRWDVYTSGYVTRVVEALENDYPALARILGEGPFRSLTARYLAACPPRSFNLGRAGDRLARFLEQDPLTAELPFLPDLARLEWALAEAFVAADVEPLLWSDLAALGPEAAADSPLALRPGTALLRSAWPVRDVWSCKDRPDDEISVDVEGRPSIVLVHRRGLDVRCRVVDDVEARVVEAAEKCWSLGRLLEAEGQEDEESTNRFVTRFRHLVEQGVFVSKVVPDGPANH